MDLIASQILSQLNFVGTKKLPMSPGSLAQDENLQGHPSKDEAAKRKCGQNGAVEEKYIVIFSPLVLNGCQRQEKIARRREIAGNLGQFAGRIREDKGMIVECLFDKMIQNLGREEYLGESDQDDHEHRQIYS